MAERRREDMTGSRDDRRGGERSRDDRGGERGREERGRDDRGGRDERGGRDRGDDRGGRDGGRGRDDRGGSGGGSDYIYQRRSAEDVRSRASQDSKFDKILLPGVAKMWTPHDGENRVRFLPPTWKGAKHYGYDIYVHYGVGPDRQSYLDLTKMQDGAPDPITEEYERFRRIADSEVKADEEYLRDLRSTQRVLVWLVDLDDMKEGVQAWSMPRGLDMDIVKISIDKDNGAVLEIDHPEEGYDVYFDKDGKGIGTKYKGIQIARNSTPLRKAEWLDFAVKHPLPDQLQFFDYDHIAKAFGGGGSHISDRDRTDDRGRREAPADAGRRSGGGDREERGRGGREEADLSWEGIHSMKPRELDDLIEARRLNINPKEAKDDGDLADWICDVMKVEKAPERRRAEPDDASERKLAEMRERRGHD